ncbi:MAG: hypothetical protein J5492_01925 [Oxalobacter sp.]|nr:hypothetical protein [Oxalobacter sp.]
MLIKPFPFTVKRTPRKPIERFRNKKRPLWVKPESHPLCRSWVIWMTRRNRPLPPSFTLQFGKKSPSKRSCLATCGIKHPPIKVWMLLLTKCIGSNYRSFCALTLNTSAKHRTTI